MKIVPSWSLQEAADSTVEYSYFSPPQPENRLDAVQGASRSRTRNSAPSTMQTPDMTAQVSHLHWGTSVEANKKDTPANSSPDLLDVGPRGLEAEKDEEAPRAGRREAGRSRQRQPAVPVMPYPYAQQFPDVNWNWHGYNMNAQATTRPEHKWQGSAGSSHETYNNQAAAAAMHSTWRPAQGANTKHYSV